MPRYIVYHKFRPDRRAVHDTDRRVLIYEYLAGDVWKPDYTTYDSHIQTDYFKEFYGKPNETAT